MMGDRINPELLFIEKPLPADDPLERKPVIDLAVKNLNWQSSVNLDEGLDPTIYSFRQAIEVNN